MDITGSMGKAWDGVRASVIKLIKKICIEEELPVKFVIVPYTEKGSGSYASWHEFDNPADTISFVESIKLCHPPSHPHIDAHGGDSDENVKGGMAIIYKNIETDIPYIWFHVTDAGWHSIGGSSSETHAEEKFLDELQINTHDFFEIWNNLIQKNPNIFWCPILVRCNCIDRAYAQMTKQTNGFLVTTQSRFRPKQIFFQAKAPSTQQLSFGHPNTTRRLVVASFILIKIMILPSLRCTVGI